MSGPFKEFCDAIATQVVSQSSDPARGQAPYYVYGSAHFDSADGTPPQVRWAPASDAEIAFVQLDKGPSRSGGSFATWQQEFRCRVWAADQQSLFNETLLQTRAANEVIKSYRGLNPTSDTYPLTWVDIDDELEDHGYMIEFSVPASIQMPVLTATTVQILTASSDISSSVGSAGSGTFVKNVVTSSAP